MKIPVNSLAPGKFEWNFRYVIFKRISVIDGWGIFCEIALIWMSLDFTDDQSTLVQVMAWCRQAQSHHLSQCWPRSLSPYDVTRPQLVNKRLFLHATLTVNTRWQEINIQGCYSLVKNKINFSTFCSRRNNHESDITIKVHCIHMTSQFRERERLSLSAFLRTEDIGVHIVHISLLIITYTLE